MRFINRNAYIMCAIKNTNFCKSAYSAFNLIMRNLARVVVLDSVVDFLLFLGKLVIVVITGSVSYLAFAGHLPDIKVVFYNKLLYFCLINEILFLGSDSLTQLFRHSHHIHCDWELLHCQVRFPKLQHQFTENILISALSSVCTPWPWTLSSSASWRIWRGTTEAGRDLTTCPQVSRKSWGKWRKLPLKPDSGLRTNGLKSQLILSSSQR